MTTYRVHALSDTQYLRPCGECYAPQILLTRDGYDFYAHELNAEYLPISGQQLANAYDSLGHDDELTARWARIVTGCNVIAVPTVGYSQGDYGTNFVFAPPAWLTLTGAPGITSEDANDLSAWVWGDVYEVTEITQDDDDDEGETFHAYGMDAAMKYGEIKFPRTVSYETYDD